MSEGDGAVQLFVVTLVATGVIFTMMQTGRRYKWSARAIILVALALAAGAIFGVTMGPFASPVGSLLGPAGGAAAWFLAGAAISALVTWAIAMRRFGGASSAAATAAEAAARAGNLTVGYDTRTGRVATSFADGTPAVFIRLKVSNHTGRTAHGCRAHLIGVGRPVASGNVIPSGYAEHVPLTWAADGGAPLTVIDIPPGGRAMLDVLCLKQGGTVLIATPAFRQPSSLNEDFFRRTTLSVLTLSVVADGLPAQTVTVQARHTGTLYDSAAALLAG
jgi:hypothetical protein